MSAYIEPTIKNHTAAYRDSPTGIIIPVNKSPQALAGKDLQGFPYRDRLTGIIIPVNKSL